MLYKLLKKYFKGIPIDNKLVILNQKYGHQLSRELNRSIDINQNELPWFTYPFIEFLNQFNLSEFNIFEWGSGNSSKYFAKRCKSIISVEHDILYIKSQKETLFVNQQLIFATERDYANKILAFKNHFDIIIIDGILRGECVLNAMKNLTYKGIIIYDNSDRDPENCFLLRENGYKQIDFSGFGPINDYTWTTSIFFKEFSLKPIGVQPLIPLGGGY